MSEPLKFKVAPHIVKDLGLNLYTTLSRVLVEYIANAYDADSPHVMIDCDCKKINESRRQVKQDFIKEMADGEDVIIPLEERVLPANHRIIIEDEGIGMSRVDLNNKFLVAGRNRRESDDGNMTPGGRLVMGRKGLGKLAGFGVAKKIQVITRSADSHIATKIELSYDDLIQVSTTDEIKIDDEKLDDKHPEFLKKPGTKIVLSHLLYDPTKNREETIKNAIYEAFQMINSKDFFIMYNEESLEPQEPDFAYAWPEPEKGVKDFVEHAYNYGGKEHAFKYRIRFRKEKDALPAQKRGIRVYAHNRLAAPPSLLEADTNMHGFRMTDYLDGVVNADFIDEQETDYIATDRQGLRWDSPLLSHLNEFLSKEIKKACNEYQKLRDSNAIKDVEEDIFTTSEVNKLDLSTRDKRLAVKVASILKSAYPKGLSDPEYREKLPIVLSGIGQGSLLSKITKLSQQENPRFNDVSREIAKLAADEYDQFVSYAKIRIKAIIAFERLVKSADFKLPQNEKIVQQMFEKSPWLLNPEFSQYLTANETFNTFCHNLTKYLEIGTFATSKAIESQERPDLVFLLSNVNHAHILIIELKSTNIPLDSSHLDQLQSYMAMTEEWVNTNFNESPKIEGVLIGTFAPETSTARKVLALKQRMKERGVNSQWRVLSYDYVLSQTQKAHNELIRIYSSIENFVNPSCNSSTE